MHFYNAVKNLVKKISLRADHKIWHLVFAKKFGRPKLIVHWKQAQNRPVP